MNERFEFKRSNDTVFSTFFEERTEVTGVCNVSRNASGSCVGGDLNSHAVGSKVGVYGIGI